MQVVTTAKVSDPKYKLLTPKGETVLPQVLIAKSGIILAGLGSIKNRPGKSSAARQPTGAAAAATLK